MLIIADDLTGAADAAAAFARTGKSVMVVLATGEHDDDVGSRVAECSVDVCSIDIGSRQMTLQAAMTATTAVMASLRNSAQIGAPVLVKIDSTMRGHVRQTVEAVLAALPSRPGRVVVAPAFPTQGRTVIEGCVYVDGEPLPNGNLREIFSGFPPGAGLFLAAAQTNEHLATLVRSTPENVLWVGSAGLAAHLARDLDSAAAGSAPADDDRDEPVPDFACSNVVVAVGSQHEQSLRQLALLDSIGPRNGVRIIRLDPRDQAFLEQALPTLAASDGLVLTGGQTARAVLDLLGVGQFEVRGEITSGVPWGTFQRQGREVAVVTKAGGFGDDRILDRAVRFLSRTQ